MAALGSEAERTGTPKRTTSWFYRRLESVICVMPPSVDSRAAEGLNPDACCQAAQYQLEN